VQITRNTLETATGPNEWFTGDVYIDTVAAPATGSKVTASSVFFEPGEDHWHGASPTRFMTHVAIFELDEQGNGATWGEHVSDEEYGAAPSIDA